MEEIGGGGGDTMDLGNPMLQKRDKLTVVGGGRVEDGGLVRYVRYVCRHLE